MTMQVPFRATKFGQIDTVKTVREDGSIVVHSAEILHPYSGRLTERLLHWADVVPDKMFIGRRVF